MKRIPRERLDAEIRLHRLANLNLIRNWVGQSTGEDFYELCDKYGILVWDEFFQPNPPDGPDPTDIRLISPMCATRCCASAIIPPSCCGARATKAIRHRRSTLLCASCWPSSNPRAAISPVPPTAPACAPQGPIIGGAARVLHRDRRLLQNRDRQRERAYARIHPWHDAQKRLGDDQRRLGRARLCQGQLNAAINIPA